MLARVEHRCPTCLQFLPVMDRFGLTLRADIGVVERGGNSAKLTAAPMLVFECLLDAYPRAVPRKELFSQLYDERDKQPEPHVIFVYLGKVRKAIEPLGIRVENHFGYGYRLVFADLVQPDISG